jgi:hypothetical protein
MTRIERLCAALVMAAVSSCTAVPATPVLGDDDLVAYAQRFHNDKWPAPPPSGGVGRYRGFTVRVDVWCTGDDGCTFDYVIHYDIHPGAECESAGGHTVQAPTGGTVVTLLQPFCVPRILYDRRLYTGPALMP